MWPEKLLNPSLTNIIHVSFDDPDLSTEIHGRHMNTMNSQYLLPVDHDEIWVSPDIYSAYIYLSFLPSVQSLIITCSNFSFGEWTM